MVQVRHRRFHPAQCQVAAVYSSIRAVIPTSIAHAFAGVTCEMSTLTSGSEEASASQSSRVAVRRLVAASSWGEPSPST